MPSGSRRTTALGVARCGRRARWSMTRRLDSSVPEGASESPEGRPCCDGCFLPSSGAPVSRPHDSVTYELHLDLSDFRESARLDVARRLTRKMVSWYTDVGVGEPRTSPPIPSSGI